MNTQRESIEKRLESDSPEVRRRALLDLAGEMDANTTGWVIRALGDEDWRVRKEAVRIAAQGAADASVIERLIEAMVQEENVGLRNAAAEALAQAGAKAIEEVAAQLPAMDPGGRKIAIEVLGASGKASATDVLIEALSDEDFNVRACAAEWLGELGGPKAVSALTGCLSGADKILVLAALQSLNQLRAVLPWEILEPLSKYTLFGAEVLLAMGRSGDPRAAKGIVAKLTNEPAAVRALELLHETNDPSARAVEDALGAVGREEIDRLAEFVQDPEPVMQRAATRCLLWTRSISHLPSIVHLAQHESLYPLLVEELGRWGEPAIRELERLLGELVGRNLASDIGLLSRLLSPEDGAKHAGLFADFLESDDLVVATAAAGAVARFGDETVAERLLELIGSEDERVRRTASFALTDVGKRHPDVVRGLLKGVDLEGERGVHLCRVLQAIGKPEDAPVLVTAIGSPNPVLRRAVVGALAAVAKEAAVETISLAMTDEDMGVCMAAAGALADIGPAAAETIISALPSAEGPLKGALLRALGRVGHAEAPAILKGMFSESADVALAALEAIERLGIDPKSLHREILHHPDSEVIKRALSVLDTGLEPADQFHLLGHPAWDVRLAVVDRLAEGAGRTNVRAALEERLKSENDDLVRNALESALEPSGEKR